MQNYNLELHPSLAAEFERWRQEIGDEQRPHALAVTATEVLSKSGTRTRPASARVSRARVCLSLPATPQYATYACVHALAASRACYAGLDNNGAAEASAAKLCVMGSVRGN
jgi:hypothetical protein